MLIKYKIPIIPTEVKEFLKIIGNACETSSYLLAKDSGIVLTSDRRAFIKLKRMNVSRKFELSNEVFSHFPYLLPDSNINLFNLPSIFLLGKNISLDI